MAYNRTGYCIRAKVLHDLAAQHYEPGRQDRCLKWVWRWHVRSLYGIGYRTFLRYLKAAEADTENPPEVLFFKQK